VDGTRYGSDMTATRIRAWIFGLTFIALVVGGWTVGGSAYATGGAVALVMLAALVAVRAFAGVAIFRFGRAARPVPAYARTRTNGVGRQIDPDAPGRARPRAPGCSASL
jgi:uncharacterized protein DUF6412